MNTNDWLAQLKVGDAVLVSSGWRGMREERVRSITATQIRVGTGSYRRDTGWGKGSTRGSLYEATPERLQEIKDERRLNVLSGELDNVRWRSLPLSVLEQVNAVLESHKQKEDEG